jgi:hypothetical protein
MSYENIVNNPELWALEIVACHDCAGDYEFDMYCVLKDKEGDHYYAHDSGCSCPIPFEDYQSVESLSPLNDFEDFKSMIMGWTGAGLDDKLILIGKVRESIESYGGKL